MTLMFLKILKNYILILFSIFKFLSYYKMIGGAFMNPYGYQPNAVYQTPYYQPSNCSSRGASWVAIALVIFLLLIICCCCFGNFRGTGM